MKANEKYRLEEENTADATVIVKNSKKVIKGNAEAVHTVADAGILPDISWYTV